MRRFALLVAILIPMAAFSQTPPPVNVDKLLDDYSKIVSQEMELEKQRAAKEKEIRDALAAQQKRLDELRLGPIAPITPADAFTQSIQDAYSRTPDADKADSLAILTQFFLDNKKYVNDQAITSTGGLLNVLVASRRAGIPDTKIVEVRKIIDAPLMAIAGKNSQPLTQAIRDALSGQFDKTIKALKEIK